MRPRHLLTLPLLASAAQPATSGLGRLHEFLATGGYVMLMIVLCSFLAVTVIISAWLRLRDHLVLPASVMSQLRSLPNYAAKGDIKPLQEFLDNLITHEEVDRRRKLRGR